MSGALLTQAIQEVINKSIKNAMLSDYRIGVVETVNPLSIRLDQKETLTEEFLILTDLVRDYDVDITVNHTTENNVDITVNHTTENKSGGSGDAQFESHNHAYSGRKRITVHNSLAVGESVILIQQSGGQEFLVLSRSQNHANLSGQWG